MNRLARVILIPLLMFILSVTFGLMLPGIVYPPVKDEGGSSSPLQTLNRDLALDDQRRMVFLGVTLAGAVLSVGTGIWLKRKLGPGQRPG